jgi:hypothetical protein
MVSLELVATEIQKLARYFRFFICGDVFIYSVQKNSTLKKLAVVLPPQSKE